MADFIELIDLAAERLGGSVLWATDDFFAEKENLLKPEAAVWREHEYTDRGKWMDGWESRRRRTPGHDSCLVKLGLPGVLRGVVVDTAFFRGNYPEHASLERVGDGGKRPQRPSGGKPSLCLPPRDAQVHRGPVRHVVGAVIHPGLFLLELGQRTEEFPLKV